tara:strand:- start:3666 stop:3863 length:198 start_codon:yes stop_codon:yes gene_type:complete
MAYKKIKSGEASFISEQKFNTVEDAHNNSNPTSEEDITIQEVKIEHTRIKKEEDNEEVKKNVLGQ